MIHDERLSHISLSTLDAEDIVSDPAAQYNIGKSQKLSVHIPTFLQKNEADPAIKASFSLLFQNTKITSWCRILYQC
jgi:hypothetical protein